ncbi:MAG: aminotransferase class III-fold pyridoxal phosphate-dependent enzyme [Planctomycetota bacterium]|jgi:acetylornithine/succinyldiaminopimelate/putrescine aminotransferase
MLTTALDSLETLRQGRSARTIGLTAQQLQPFLDDASLQAAIHEAMDTYAHLQETSPELLELSEDDLRERLQRDFVNFYTPATVNPYVPLAARGPWVITSHGAVIHDNGGYGMLGAGHAPQAILDTMARPWVMANIMTASHVQHAFTQRLFAEVGHTRAACPFSRLLCMNSGSESVTVAGRLSDANAKTHTDPGGAHEGHTIKFMAHRLGFHGRTDRPAQVSDSSLPKYRAHLASFRGRDNLITLEPNDIEGLHRAFDEAEEQNVFVEALFLEPVLGEGNPGLAITRPYYDAARERTLRMGTLLVIDSIQAGLRTHGVLSIVDYPGFEDAEAPDLETYSKALNAGQFPLSVLVMTERAAKLYATGTYGNTMTSNPRGLAVATKVLEGITPAFRRNVRERGAELHVKLEALRAELPHAITSVQGTGLLIAAELDPERYPVVGFGGVEEQCRLRGLGVIHGGLNALRFTPHFGITSAEVDLIVGVVRDAINAVA